MDCQTAGAVVVTVTRDALNWRGAAGAGALRNLVDQDAGY